MRETMPLGHEIDRSVQYELRRGRIFCRGLLRVSQDILVCLADGNWVGLDLLRAAMARQYGGFQLRRALAELKRKQFIVCSDAAGTRAIRLTIAGIGASRTLAPERQLPAADILRSLLEELPHGWVTRPEVAVSQLQLGSIDAPNEPSERYRSAS